MLPLPPTAKAKTKTKTSGFYITVFRYYNFSAGFNTPVNYFSSPTYEIDGVRAGNEDFADCRRVHLENMQAMSQLGDESYVCGIENNVNYPGNDVNWGPLAKQPNAESCRSYCESSNWAPKPSYFTWIGSTDNHRPEDRNSCWCKTALDQGRKINQADVFSGPIKCPTTPPVCGIEKNINFPGNDVNWGPYAKQPNVESCRSYCESSNWAPKPAYFTWIGSSDNHTPDARNSCWCKTALDEGRKINQADVFSGPIKCPTTEPCADKDPAFCADLHAWGDAHLAYVGINSWYAIWRCENLKPRGKNILASELCPLKCGMCPSKYREPSCEDKHPGCDDMANHPVARTFCKYYGDEYLKHCPKSCSQLGFASKDCPLP